MRSPLPSEEEADQALIPESRFVDIILAIYMYARYRPIISCLAVFFFNKLNMHMM